MGHNCTSYQFLIHVDQCPYKISMVSMQSTDLEIFTCFENVLELLRKLVQSLGNSVMLKSQKYILILYHKDALPINCQSRTNELSELQKGSAYKYSNKSVKRTKLEYISGGTHSTQKRRIAFVVR